MRVGSIGYATDQGLGILMKMFFDAGVVTDVMVVRHGSRPTHDDWYQGAAQITDLNSQDQRRAMGAFCDEMDAMLFFETPFDWELINVCRRAKVRTVMMPMYECMPRRWPTMTDAVINPSALDQRYYPNGVHIPVPAPADIEWKERGPITTFVHNAGHGGLRGRNGTAELMAAWSLVKTPARLIVRSQEVKDTFINSMSNQDFRTGKVITHVGAVDRGELYAEGECFVFPEKFNGLSLPLQEAFSAGMVVAATDRLPNNTYLPTGPLIPTCGERKTSIAARLNQYTEVAVHPKDIAERIDSLYGSDARPYSLLGKQWAEENSWANLKPKYLEVLHG